MPILAADLGGTRARVVGADGDGAVGTRAEAGAGNPVRVGVERASEGLRAAAEQAMRMAGGPDIVAAAVGMAGFSHRAAPKVVAAALDALAVRPVVRVLVDDGAIAFRAAFAGPSGALVMAGTGSGARARGEKGTVILGGWGGELGDEGSAHDIGREAVRACLRAAQLGERLPVLGNDVLAHAGVAEVRFLPNLVRRGELLLADLCAVVMAAAQEGDEVAHGILVGASRSLYAQALAAASAAGVPDQTALATTGSVLASGAVREGLDGCCTRGPFTPGPHIDEPVLGAVALARDALAAGGTVPPGW